MADVETDNERDTNPHPFNSDPIPSLNNPIRFTNVEDDNSDNDDKKPPYQGHGLPKIAMTKIQKLIPYALEWLLDSEIPRPPKSHPSYERWKYWSRLVASWIYNQIDVTLQNKLRNLSKMPKYADNLYDELMTMTQGSDRIQTAFLEMRKFDKMKRSDYNSASEYIEEYQKQYHVLARFKAEPHPVHALSQVLQNLELEVKKVQFIREEVAGLEPKKLSLDKVEEYWRALQAAADMEGVTNASYNSGRGGRGNGRGGRGSNRGGRGGHTGGHDNTQPGKDVNSIDNNDNTNSGKKKKKNLRKQPANDKDIHDYAREMRNEGQNNMVVAAACSVDRTNDWLLDTGSDKTLTHDIEDFHTYQLDHPDVAYAYKDYSGNRVVTLGHGEIISWRTCKLFGMQKLLEEQDISYNTRTKHLTNRNGDILGYADTSTGVPYLVSPREIDHDPNEIDSDSDSDDDRIGFVNKVTAYEVHRRLGHAGKARIASTLQHAEQLGEHEQYPGIWRMDGGTEFKEFIKWGEKRGITFEITPPYTAEPNGTVERFGGHINDIQRTMIIDADMPEDMWPYATETAIYIYNRLVNPKTKVSPLTH
ncbi:hypothetical protein N7530_010550 [Penicillium desertorum]|uniref:Integrase catalytic domain-containing protein n=1 Tax=Penicillium desertorum TaxID=1303715 RepID=A0A9W9WHP4_9EURO|nr:hypothetical protein N7530_010550 [Penicillium desertorum]